MDQDTFNIVYAGSLLLDDCIIEGNIRSDKDIYLKGSVNGDIHCDAILILNEGAIVNGDVLCDNLMTDGLITGNVRVAQKAQLAEHAVIKGHLTTACLLTHPKAKIGKGLKLKDKTTKQ